MWKVYKPNSNMHCSFRPPPPPPTPKGRDILTDCSELPKIREKPFRCPESPTPLPGLKKKLEKKTGAKFAVPYASCVTEIVSYTTVHWTVNQMISLTPLTSISFTYNLEQFETISSKWTKTMFCGWSKVDLHWSVVRDWLAPLFWQAWIIQIRSNVAAWNKEVTINCSRSNWLLQSSKRPNIL